MNSVPRQNFLFLGESVGKNGLGPEDEFTRLCHQYGIKDPEGYFISFLYQYANGFINRNDSTPESRKGLDFKISLRKVPLTFSGTARSINSLTGELRFEDTMCVYYFLQGVMSFRKNEIIDDNSVDLSVVQRYA